MVRSNARVASLWHRNLCIPSNRCLSTAKFIASSAISQSCRRVPSAAPCAPSSLFAAGLFRHSAPPLDPFNRNFPPSFLRPRPPAEFLWKLSDIHICPLLHQKFQARPAQLARVLSLSYKGFAATYNISSSPLFPCHFALPRHPPSPIYPLTLLITSSALFLSLFFFVPLIVNASHSLPVRYHRCSNSSPPSYFFKHLPYSFTHSSFTPHLWSFFFSRRSGLSNSCIYYFKGTVYQTNILHESYTPSKNVETIRNIIWKL